MNVTREIIIELPNLPKRIKEARLASGKGPKEIAEAAGISEIYLFRLEANKYKNIPEATLRKLEAALNVDFGANF
ncbi:helix-turn-helix transcriptional regulator [Calothrix membranacea FACHB-236]|nr:helix-turn-helix transcriptional regulator [Calothrix membranacea FACHB-236]